MTIPQIFSVEGAQLFIEPCNRRLWAKRQPIQQIPLLPLAEDAGLAQALEMEKRVGERSTAGGAGRN